jgi:4-hydroxymandelate oxidase
MAEEPLNTVRNYERRARTLVPDGMWDALFGDHGAEGWETNTKNVDGFDRVELRPRVLVDVSRRALATTVLGTEISLPVMIAPSGLHQRVHADGELATAQAAAAARTLMVLSTASTYSIEEVAAVATGPLWFQLYFMRDRRVTERLVRRAEEAGYRAIVLTVDIPGIGGRRRWTAAYDIGREAEFAPLIEPERVMRNFRDLDIDGVDLSHKRGWLGGREAALTWGDLAWLRDVTSLPLVIKGVQAAGDAALAVEHGVDGVVVSNHGGFSLPGGRATIEVLPEVVEAAPDLEIYLDGGVRRGVDVLKALALGARAVLIGRANFWGLAVGGAEGAADVLEIIREELDAAMAFCGVTDVQHVDRGLVAG